ncbi:unnamed protein product [Enterobius vermicularis]|uniref:C3H1-type domain-containing protein n=1 Tax=Enterobius vermicularis TaxID=51028 RepID=A0A0N4UVQ6_ENTVE|nr:unnamed protein product [Enterobius vermicularis]
MAHSSRSSSTVGTPEVVCSPSQTPLPSSHSNFPHSSPHPLPTGLPNLPAIGAPFTTFCLASMPPIKIQIDGREYVYQSQPTLLPAIVTPTPLVCPGGMPSEQQDIKSAGYGNSSSAIPDRRSVNPTAIVLIPQQPNYLPQPFQYVVPNSYNMPVPVGPCDQYNPLPATAQPTNGLPVPPPIIGYPAGDGSFAPFNDMNNDQNCCKIPHIKAQAQTGYQGPRRKPKICKGFAKRGYCTYSNCKFLHETEVLNTRMYKENTPRSPALQ